MPDYKAVARRDARKEGLPVWMFMNQIRQESGFNPNAHSPAGAEGIAQIVPKWHPGVNAHDPIASLAYAAHWMSQLYHKYGNMKDALSVYNSGKPWAQGQQIGETNAYVKKIMGNRTAVANFVRGKSVPNQVQPAQTDNKAMLMQYLMQSNTALAQGQQSPSIMPTMMLMKQAQEQQPLPLSITNRKYPVAPGHYKLGSTTFASAADRAGVHTSQKVINFVNKVSGIYGSPLTIGTGTNHSKMTASGNVSDHWSGNAADIPASGAALTKLGQAALIAAGANPKWAHQQQGGLYNLNGHQIIFNTNAPGVGNHYNHLHVSAK